MMSLLASVRSPNSLKEGSKTVERTPLDPVSVLRGGYRVDFERDCMLTCGIPKSIHYLLLVSSKHVLASAWHNAQHSSFKRLDEEMSGYRRLKREEEPTYIQPSFADFDNNQHKFRVEQEPAEMDRLVPEMDINMPSFLI
ncbi:unnamed protein product [Larinioides sclopetarius]|uniref:Uncharacterized protein n=1 Tax=Larinioides sclopetarius TaxID=280406 RepID=A0AAV2B600_9ARAC